MRNNIIGVLVSGAVATALLTGCSASQPAANAPASASQHNAADVAFASDMVPHHQQALAMTKMVAAHTANQQVRTLAGQIDKAQGPEITLMQGWLSSWHVAMPSMSNMPGMSGGSMQHPGMMSDAQMSQLATEHGAAFDKTWLSMMTQHHQGAITMSNTELRSGQNPDAKALAKRIISSQQAQINQMKSMLG